MKLTPTIESGVLDYTKPADADSTNFHVGNRPVQINNPFYIPGSNPQDIYVLPRFSTGQPNPPYLVNKGVSITNGLIGAFPFFSGQRNELFSNEPVTYIGTSSEADWLTTREKMRAGAGGDVLGVDPLNHLTYDIPELRNLTEATWMVWARSTSTGNDYKAPIGNLNGQQSSGYGYLRIKDNGSNQNDPRVVVDLNVGGASITSTSFFGTDVLTDNIPWTAAGGFRAIDSTVFSKVGFIGKGILDSQETATSGTIAGGSNAFRVGGAGVGADPSRIMVYQILVWNRPLSDAEFDILTKDPFAWIDRANPFVLAVRSPLVFNVASEEFSAVTDTPASTASMGVSQTETNPVTDTPVATADYPVAISETNGVTDTATSEIAEVDATQSETNAVTDTVTNTATRVATQSETTAATDTVTATEDYVVAIAETNAVTDTPVASADYPVTISEPNAVTDTVTGNIVIVANQSEPVAVTDTITNTAERVATQSEPNAITDTVTGSAEKPVSISEPNAITDTVSNTVDVSGTISEPNAITDTVSNTADRVGAISETGVVTDTLAGTTGNDGAIVESNDVTDQQSTTIDYAVAVSESTAVSDSVDATIITAADITEAVVTSDTVIASVDFAPVSVSETMSTSDIWTNTAERTGTIVETINIEDTPRVSENSGNMFQMFM